MIVRVGGSWLSAHEYVLTTYTEEEIDLFAVYCGELDRSFLVPASLAAGRRAIQLRLAPCRNNQRACINLASDFDFEGAVAQLARAPHWQCGGRGFESPQLHSTPTKPLAVGSNCFRDRFGYWMDRVAGGEHLVITRCGKPLIRLLPEM